MGAVESVLFRALPGLALHPKRRTDPEARRTLDLPPGRETRERHTLTCKVGRQIGVELGSQAFSYGVRSIDIPRASGCRVERIQAESESHNCYRKNHGV